MYVSIRDAAIIGAGYDNLLEGLQALNLKAVELEFSHGLETLLLTGGKTVLDSPEAIANYADHLSEHGVKGTAFLLTNNFNHDDLESELTWIVDTVNIAETLGMAAIRIDSVMSGERDWPLQERIGRFVECISKVIERTPDSNVQLGMENHGFQGNDPDFLDGVINGVGSDRVGMTLDTGNFYWRGHPIEKVYEIIEHFAPYTRHTHVKNINYPENVRNTQREMGWKYGEYVSPIPDGDIDHARVVEAFKAVNYEGDLCIEDESLGRFKEDERKAILKRDAEYLLGLV